MIFAMKQNRSEQDSDKIPQDDDLKHLKSLIDHNDTLILRVKQNLNDNRKMPKYSKSVSKVSTGKVTEDSRHSKRCKWVKSGIKCNRASSYVSPTSKISITRTERSFISSKFKHVSRSNDEELMEKNNPSVSQIHASTLPVHYIDENIINKWRVRNLSYNRKLQNISKDRNTNDQPSQDRKQRLKSANSKSKVKRLNFAVKPDNTSIEMSQDQHYKMSTKLSPIDKIATLDNSNVKNIVIAPPDMSGQPEKSKPRVLNITKNKEGTDKLDPKLHGSNLVELQSEKRQSFISNDKRSTEKTPKNSGTNERQSRKFSIIRSNSQTVLIENPSTDKQQAKLSKILVQNVKSKVSQLDQSKQNREINNGRSNYDSKSIQDNNKGKSVKTPLSFQNLIQSLGTTNPVIKTSFAKLFQNNYILTNTRKITDLDTVSDRSDCETEDIQTKVALEYTRNLLDQSSVSKMRNTSGNFLPMKIKEGIKDEFRNFGGIDGITNIGIPKKKLKNVKLTARESVIALSHMIGLKQLLDLGSKLDASNENSLEERNSENERKEDSDKSNTTLPLLNLTETQPEQCRSLITTKKTPKASGLNERQSHNFSLAGSMAKKVSIETSSPDKYAKMPGILAQNVNLKGPRHDQSKHTVRIFNDRSNHESTSINEDNKHKSSKRSSTFQNLIQSLGTTNSSVKNNLVKLFQHNYVLTNTRKITNLDTVSDRSDCEAEDIQTKLALEYTNTLLDQSSVSKIRNTSGNFLPMKLTEEIKNEYQNYGCIDGLTNITVTNSSLKNVNLTARESVVALSHMVGLKKLLDLDCKLQTSTETSLDELNSDIEAIFQRLMFGSFNKNDDSQVEDNSF